MRLGEKSKDKKKDGREKENDYSQWPYTVEKRTKNLTSSILNLGNTEAYLKK